ncbi:hypothetical protein POSPLADRAFT_1155335 [Postia placenta MAD-698-R-SB12]|uniref:DUF6532 domain-containing protein n=1 Tax=Postia placenta MAD-698-R-SB12 TaxID=670580 RepID=A0A1X6MNT0_9APHY|nr:hypothetical protein POSPLADRAFT_1155335 [Postia placenta MAD-698-R-SB12]OSX57852.1 hypothetical protein POSPLADRAFT_1155335 [Postia placenta MAD-698-R-SB12]
MVYTRQSNVNKHPGNILKGTPHRPPDIIAEERHLAAQAKQLIADQQAASLQRLAELENHLEEEHSQAATFGSSPSHVEHAGGGGRANILDSAVEHPSNDRGGVGKPKQVHASNAPTPKMPAKAAPQSTTSKMAKKSRTTRADIDAHRNSLLNADLNDKPIVLVSGKRKSSKDSSVPTVVKKARAANPSGLLAGWTQHDSSMSPAAGTQFKHLTHVSLPPSAMTAMDVRDYGGYVSSEDDGTEECELARSSQNITKGVVAIKREDPAIMIKTELATSHNSVTGEAGSGANGGFVKVDLPAGAEPRWSKEYIPTVLDYIGTLPNPWDIAAVNFVKVFQQIWDLVFPDILYLVNDKGAVYALTQQKIYDWRSGFAKSAADHVARLFQLDILEELKKRRLENTAEGHATYVAQQITGNYLFLYGDVKVSKDDGSIVSWNKPFQSQLVLATLAYHMNATAGAILYIEATPRGALAMSTVAVECAIGMYTTGTYITPREKFAEQIWSRVLNLYKISIETLMPGTWDVIVDSANGLAALNRNLPNLNEAAGPVDGRALITDYRWYSCKFGKEPTTHLDQLKQRLPHNRGNITVSVAELREVKHMSDVGQACKISENGLLKETKERGEDLEQAGEETLDADRPIDRTSAPAPGQDPGESPKSSDPENPEKGASGAKNLYLKPPKRAPDGGQVMCQVPPKPGVRGEPPCNILDLLKPDVNLPVSEFLQLLPVLPAAVVWPVVSRSSTPQKADYVESHLPPKLTGIRRGYVKFPRNRPWADPRRGVRAGSELLGDSPGSSQGSPVVDVVDDLAFAVPEELAMHISCPCSLHRCLASPPRRPSVSCRPFMPVGRTFCTFQLVPYGLSLRWLYFGLVIMVCDAHSRQTLIIYRLVFALNIVG